MGNLTLLLLLVVYFGLLMLVAHRMGKQGGNEAFFTGNRKAPWYVVSIGMIGSSVSGISFVSVPGMVAGNAFMYLQTVFGFFAGYILLAKFLLPVYYKQNSPSIYVYLEERFGQTSYKTGAWFFMLSKLMGASARVYVAVLVLQEFVLGSWGLPFWFTTICVIAMIWLYTFRGGTKTIVWTDLIQTVFMVAAMILMLLQFSRGMELSFSEILKTVVQSPQSHVFEFSDWSGGQYFFKQFLSGIFIVLVMTGLDQEMIQKNRAIRRLDQAQRNMYWYGFMFIPINLILLVTGLLMYQFAAAGNIALPDGPDAVLPVLATQHFAGGIGVVLLLIGVVSATFSGADSSMTSLTTSFCIDILDKQEDVRMRKIVHAVVAFLFVLFILLFRAFNNTTLINAIYTLASYTYGPLLGMFAFGLLTRRVVRDSIVPRIAVLSPVLCFGIQWVCNNYFNYTFSYELLMLNGLITFTGLLLTSRR